MTADFTLATAQDAENDRREADQDEIRAEEEREEVARWAARDALDQVLDAADLGRTVAQRDAGHARWLQVAGRLAGLAGGVS